MHQVQYYKQRSSLSYMWFIQCMSITNAWSHYLAEWRFVSITLI